MESSLIQKLDRCLLSSHPILFTGAGFSLGEMVMEKQYLLVMFLKKTS